MHDQERLEYCSILKRKVLQLNVQTYCRLKERERVVTAHSEVVKSSCVGPLHCSVLGNKEN